jgi:hypothetical protein
MSGLVNHNGRVTEKEAEAIKASDLMKLMDVVQSATGLYNALENAWPKGFPEISDEFCALGDALRALGLTEVT